MRLNQIAQRARIRQFWHTPYDTGNLAQSIGDLSGITRSRYYIPFNANRRAEYGAILNESPTIRYRVRQGGQTTFITRINKHYQWFDKFVEMEADLIDLENGTVRG